MSEFLHFRGFPQKCITFYRNLADNNNTVWFNSHRKDFEDFVLAPARSFVTEMGKRLLSIAPGINADPRVNHSLFRINRDTRFSKNKSPYKTNLALWFWEGSGPRLETSGFYVHMEPEMLMLCVGIYRFPKPLLEKYREYVVHSKHGTTLAKALDKVMASGPYSIGGGSYKRVPRGYDPSHKYAALLLHDGLYAGVELAIPGEFFSHEFLDYCFERFNQMHPIHTWLMNLVD